MFGANLRGKNGKFLLQLRKFYKYCEKNVFHKNTTLTMYLQKNICKISRILG